MFDELNKVWNAKPITVVRNDTSRNATYSKTTYSVSCNLQPTTVKLTIGGRIFEIPWDELFYERDSVCYLRVQLTDVVYAGMG